MIEWDAVEWWVVGIRRGREERGRKPVLVPLVRASRSHIMRPLLLISHSSGFHGQAMTRPGLQSTLSSSCYITHANDFPKATDLLLFGVLLSHCASVYHYVLFHYSSHMFLFDNLSHDDFSSYSKYDLFLLIFSFIF